MPEVQTQTASGTMPAISRDGRDLLLNWEAKESVQDGKETVHIHTWTTDNDNNAVQVHQFFGTIISPRIGHSGAFHSPLNVSDYEADVTVFDVPEPLDVGLQVGMLLSDEKNRDQSITDVGNINFASVSAS